MSFIYTIQELQNKLKPIFEVEPIYTAFLFGSYAKGEATENSDIDIVIDSHRELLNIRFYGVLEDITQTLGKKIDLFELVEIRPNSPIYSEIFETGIVIYEKSVTKSIVTG